jgi:hypothetical protein
MAIKFETNIPVELRLRFLEGKEVESKFGGIQYMFTAEEGSIYVSDAVGRILADQVRRLNVRTGEPIEICKREVASNGRKSIQWQVTKTGFAPGEQADGTLAVPAPPSERKPAVIERTAAAAPPAWAGVLVDQTNALIDAYAAVLKHSARHEGLVKGDDVRSIFLSAFINVSKSGANGGRNAA